MLILRATDLLHGSGLSLQHAAAVAVLLYAGHNAANSLAAYPAGVLADRFGRRRVLTVGITLFGTACVIFAFNPTKVALLAPLFVAVGCSTALVETGEGAHAAELLHDSVRGRGFGLLGLVDGIGDLVSSVLVGILWTVTEPAWGFAYAAALSVIGASVLASGRDG